MGIGVVATNYGKLQGVECTEGKYTGITYFKGIRYGASTAGANRWKPPVPPESWKGVKVCDTYAPAAMQPGRGGLGEEPYASDFYWEGQPAVSEDCLFLNVTTGAVSSEEKRPVFIWFHGGGLGGGYSYEVPFDNSELARKGIVVVTVGQRLNVFGYLALPQLSAEQGGVSGNYGLMDEVLALDWVYDNISAFGGDPENITLGGQSGGTAKAGALAGSPVQKGRVKRVIEQSNLYWVGRPIRTAKEHEEICVEFLREKGIDPNASLEELRQIPAEKFYSMPLGKPDFDVCSMVCDGKYVAFTDQAKNVETYAADCDILSGGNFGESVMSAEFALGAKEPMTVDEYYSQARKLLGNLYNKYDFENNFPCDEATVDQQGRRLAALGLTGYGGTIVNRYFGAYRKAKGMKGKTWSYLFSHVTPSRPEEAGTKRDAKRLLAWHSSELFYTFASLRKGENGQGNIPPVRPWTDFDIRLADMVSSYWANFIRTGNPNEEGLPQWPVSDENYGWMELGDEPRGYQGLSDLLDQMLLDYVTTCGRVPRI